MQNPCGFCGVQPGAHTTPPPLPGCRCVWVGHEGHEVHLLPTDVAGAEHVRVLPQGPLGPPAPRGPRASNLVGPVRGVIGLVGWRGLFQAVRHIGRKWATCTPSAPPRPPWTPQTHGAHTRRARRRSKGRARRARRRGCRCSESPCALTCRRIVRLKYRVLPVAGGAFVFGVRLFGVRL